MKLQSMWSLLFLKLIKMLSIFLVVYNQGFFWNPNPWEWGCPISYGLVQLLNPVPCNSFCTCTFSYFRISNHVVGERQLNCFLADKINTISVENSISCIATKQNPLVIPLSKREFEKDALSWSTPLVPYYTNIYSMHKHNCFKQARRSSEYSNGSLILQFLNV